MKKVMCIFTLCYLIFTSPTIQAVEDDIKDCTYCLKFEKLLEWPLDQR
tara:strand:+ start:59 stop:202 length:144 start_codon:yes stop_codon:yes gene_type:complete